MRTMELLEITSADGTQLGVERVGEGPPLLAVHGSLADRTRWDLLKEHVAGRFTLYLLDRRGRGDSTREAAGPYALDREVEDVVAVVDAIGEPVRYLGHSYGALLGLEVLTRTDQISRALLYEPAFDAPGHVIVPPRTLDDIASLLAAGERERALEVFYREVLHADPEPFKSLPMWPVRIAIAHTLEREGRIGLTYVCSPPRFAVVSAPVRILLGTESPASFGAAAMMAAGALPHGEIVSLPGQGHTMIDADPAGFVSQVVEFMV